MAHADKFPGLCTPDDSYHGITYAERFGKEGALDVYKRQDLEIEDDLLPWNDHTFRIRFADGGCTLTDAPAEYHLKMGIGTLSTLLLGYKTAERDVYKRQLLDRAIRISSVCRRGFLPPR